MKPLLATVLLFSSCFRPRINPIDPGQIIPGPPDASGPFEIAIYWGSGLAGIAVIVGLVLLWSNPKKGQLILVSAFSVLIGAQIALWVAANLFWIGIITLVAGIGYVLYRHRDEIEDIFDGDTEKIEATEKIDAVE